MQKNSELITFQAYAVFKEGASMKQFEILVVDDNIINRRLAKLMLECLGHSVDLVKNGREAVCAVESNVYDIIFMDLHMPVMNGLEATRAIRSMDYPKNCTKIIGFTGDETFANREMYMSAGIDDIIFKPINLDMLSNSLERCFGL